MNKATIAVIDHLKNLDELKSHISKVISAPERYVKWLFSYCWIECSTLGNISLFAAE